jgi:hypothetical protein
VVPELCLARATTSKSGEPPDLNTYPRISQPHPDPDASRRLGMPARPPGREPVTRTSTYHHQSMSIHYARAGALVGSRRCSIVWARRQPPAASRRAGAQRTGGRSVPCHLAARVVAGRCPCCLHRDPGPPVVSSVARVSLFSALLSGSPFSGREPETGVWCAVG